MSKAPIWPVATDALVADTTHLSAEEFGAYTLLMFAQWRSNGAKLPADETKLAQIARLSPRAWRRMRPVLAELFEISADGWSVITRYDQRSRTVISSNVRHQVFERDNYRCVYCGSTDGPFHIDHVNPWSRGGTDDVINLATACPPCNLSKGAKRPEEWRR